MSNTRRRLAGKEEGIQSCHIKEQRNQAKNLWNLLFFTLQIEFYEMYGITKENA